MTTPDSSQVILSPPATFAPIGHVTVNGTKYSVFASEESYKHSHEIWKRTGGYTDDSPDLSNLQASEGELNTLVGINTQLSVQAQIDLKASISSLGTMASQDSDLVTITGGTVNNVTISNSTITIEAGASDVFIPVGGTLHQDTTAVGNVGAGEDDLITYSMAADTLNSTGDFIDIEAFGTFAANANNKRIKLYLGTTSLIDTGAVAANSGYWTINCKIIRTGAATQKSIASIISSNALVTNSSTYVSGAEDLTSALTVKCTGAATANNDVVQEGLMIKWFKTK